MKYYYILLFSLCIVTSFKRNGKYFGRSYSLRSNFNYDYEHMDRENMKKLEKIFYMKNRRYSPYNKQVYLNRTMNNQGEAIRISKDLINGINEELLKSFQQQIDDIADNENNKNEEDFDDFEDSKIGRAHV